MTLIRPAHEPQFYTSSARGDFAACRCGWEVKVPAVTMPAFPGDLSQPFFHAGFDAGREYERHLRVAEVR
jgi:hypothetical protein